MSFHKQRSDANVCYKDGASLPYFCNRPPRKIRAVPLVSAAARSRQDHQKDAFGAGSVPTLFGGKSLATFIGHQHSAFIAKQRSNHK